MPNSCLNGELPVLNMKKMRSLFLVLALGFGLCCQRAQAQTSEQVMTFSIICQYQTNLVTTTNLTTQTINQFQQIVTVIVNTANVAKAISLDLFGTNWVKWYPSAVCYDVNMVTGNQGILLRHGIYQTNVSSFYGNSFSNMFSQNVSNVFSGTYYTNLPVNAGWDYSSAAGTSNAYTASDNLAYLTFVSSNISFNLFGYSQGKLVNGAGYIRGQLFQHQLNEAEVVGAGTFNLNLSTNIYDVITTNGTPAYYGGLAHGTVYMGQPIFLTTEGP